MAMANMLNSNIVDLTHTISPDMPSWNGDCGFNLAVECDYNDCSGPDLFRVQKITSRAGMGTHIDAPAHCFPGAKTVDDLELETLMVNCVVIKVDGIADQDYLLMPETIQKFEKEHGKIPPHSFVIVYTGWDSRWSTPVTYRNELRFPSLDESSGVLLLERNIAGLGIDTLSPDAVGKSFPIHRMILGAGKYLVENVANAKNLPPIGANVFVMPMKIKEGTEAPVRMVALVKKK